MDSSSQWFAGLTLLYFLVHQTEPVCQVGTATLLSILAPCQLTLSQANSFFVMWAKPAGVISFSDQPSLVLRLHGSIHYLYTLSVELSVIYIACDMDGVCKNSTSCMQWHYNRCGSYRGITQNHSCMVVLQNQTGIPLFSVWDKMLWAFRAREPLSMCSFLMHGEN